MQTYHYPHHYIVSDASPNNAHIRTEKVVSVCCRQFYPTKRVYSDFPFKPFWVDWENQKLDLEILNMATTQVPRSINLFIDMTSFVNKNPTRCSSMQIFIYCKVTLHVSGVTAPIIRSTKNCNRSLRYRS